MAELSQLLAAMRIALLLCLVACPAHADDSALVHGLAHGAGGALVVSAVNIGAQGKLRGWKATAIELGLALAVDWAYEAATHKDAVTTWQHNGDAVLGAGLGGVLNLGRPWTGANFLDLSVPR